MKRFVVLFAIGALGVAAVSSAAPGDPTDLKVTKAASASQIGVGSTLTYTIVAENLGPETATGVTVGDSLPKGVDYVSATSTVGKCSLKGQKVSCEIGTLEFGPMAKVTGATVTLKVIPRKTGKITNTATVKGDQKDPVGSNDKASVTTTVLGTAPAVTCHGVPATIVGTAGSDELLGTGGRDVISGRGGGDAISSLAGRDLVCGNGGNDRVNGGGAADRAFGGSGRDRLLGRGGGDTLKGDAGNDVIKGGKGPDRIRGGGGFDTCRGGPGVDSIRGCER